MTAFSQDVYAKTVKKLFKTYMNMPYEEFTYKNSSYLNKTLISEANYLASMISGALLILSESIIVIFLFMLMLFSDWRVTLVFTVIFLIKAIFLTKTVSKKIKNAGRRRAFHQNIYYEILNRTFGNFRHIKLQSNNFLKKFIYELNKSIDSYSSANTENGRLSVVPRLFLETTGFSMIVLLVVFMLFNDQVDILSILPVLSLFVLALYRILPSINRIFTSLNSIIYYHKSFEIISDELETPQENTGIKKIKFEKNIKLVDVNFSYKGFKVFDGVNLEILFGEKVAFVGKSGSGKSTLVDLIIGLYLPNTGGVYLDNKQITKQNVQFWRSMIGYIPQHIYLFDGSVADNVVFGREYDEDKLVSALKKANIFDFLKKKSGLKTIVGENGIQLSGGQKQRIGIARALYGDPNVLVLDEATSALDEETERQIMNEIYSSIKGKTLIVITHRLSTISRSDKIFSINKGQIELAN